MGGEKFGARAYAHNFSREDMIEALQFAHFHERKLYLTVNTLMKEKELFEELGDFLFPYYENGLDGVIVQDIGAVRFIRENFPDLEIHGSTQLTVTDFRGAVAAKRMVLLLLWSMSFKQYVWRKKWKSRPLCPALPTSIYSDEC